MESTFPYLDAILTVLPPELQQQVQDICNQSASTKPCLENLVRFLGNGHPFSLQGTSPEEWAQRQCDAVTELGALDASSQTNGSSLKRSRDAGDDTVDPTSKRQKVDTPPSTNQARFTIHAISVTSPIRKKVDITICKNVIQLVNPTSGSIESTVPISSLRRAFLVPTRGKSKPHWTVIILSSDTTERVTKATKGTNSNNQQIVFGLDAVTTTPLKVTDHESTEGQTTLPKGTEALPTLLTFLSRLQNVPLLRPSLEVFKSALVQTSPGIEGYLGAKAGTLWFFPEGILWEGKPCEFWALEDLKGKTDGVRIVTATGRMCSLFLTRKSPPTEGEAEEDDGEDIGEETQFSMIDGKEQEGINSWVRKYRHLFGKGAGEPKDEPQAKEEKEKPLNAGPQTILQLDDRSDDSDEDFEASSVSEQGASSSGESDEEGGGDASGDEDEAMDTDGEAGDNPNEDLEEEELDPARHPLMRPGAMPKLSQAAMDMVVGMVEADMMGNSDDEEKDELDED
jgi:hypothetical protein